MPQRIQLRRTKGCRKPKGAVVVARPTKWGNPFRAGEVVTVPEWYVIGFPSQVPYASTTSVECRSVEHSVALFRVYAINRLVSGPEWLSELRGKDLCCWCGLDKKCHADVLLELANGG